MISNEAKAGGREGAVTALKALYESYGYSHYKMSKFEEYELYVRNKSFLVSDHVITFTDVGGSLMALKPDVTLSIVKNSPEREDGVRRVYYNENVYRVPKGALSFKEIMQAGLECIGDIDAYAVAEVLTLAKKSLEAISPDYVIDVSNMGILSALIDEIGLSAKGKEALITSIGEKNIHGIDAVCASEGKSADRIKRLVSMKGGAEEMLEILSDSQVYSEALEMAEIISAVGGRVRFDFSVIDDMNYYSGIVFKGFIKGIPTDVLTGGRYDNLMKKMGKKSGAIGFAVYIDLLGELSGNAPEYDGDVLVLYDKNTEITNLIALTNELTASGKSVSARKSIPEKLKYRETVDLRGGKIIWKC